MLKKISLAVLLTASATAAHAAAIDLSDWSPLTLTYAGGQGSGSWVLDAGNTGVTQVYNADPSFYLNNLNQTSYSIDGTWDVKSQSDDDYMGFVFGYQNSSNFYLFDWKKGDQSDGGQYAAAGMTIKKLTGATGDGETDLSLAEFWENTTDVGDMSVLAENHADDGGVGGWVTGEVYDFHLDFNQTPGEIHILVKDGDTVLWDETVNDLTFTSGQFGFFNNSQEQVHYAGFEQTGGVIVGSVAEPGTIGLIGIGLLGFGAFGRRRLKA